MPDQDHQKRALAILAAIGQGTIPAHHFTETARWWWNGGLDLPVADFLALLGQLHGQTVEGIHVLPGLIAENGDSLFIEATSHALLHNGTVYDNRYVFRFTFRDSLVDLVKEYSDSAHVNAVFALG